MGSPMEIRKIIEFAEEFGYDTVKYLGRWRGYDVYDPEDSDPDTPERVIGLPFSILVKDDEIRISSLAEERAIIARFFPDDEEDE